MTAPAWFLFVIGFLFGIAFSVPMTAHIYEVAMAEAVSAAKEVACMVLP